MGDRYIGAKTRIVDAIVTDIARLVPPGSTVADLMCGTGAIALELRKRGYRIIANDVMSQAYHITRAKVLLQEPPPFDGVKKYVISRKQTLLTDRSGYAAIIQTLNELSPIEGYFWREFSPEGEPGNGSPPRKYFTADNAKKIDAARDFIKRAREAAAVTDLEHSLLVHDLIMAANDVANIAGTYGHYLSRFVPRALQPLRFVPTKFESGGMSDGHLIFNAYAEQIAPKVEADLCYLDPPYKKRQYAANYHILETLARGDNPEAQGRSGLRPWRDEYSNFCSKVKIRDAFDTILDSIHCDRVMVSYNSEGLLTKEQLVSILADFGKVNVREFPYKRFKSRSDQSGEDVTEYVLVAQRRASHEVAATIFA